MNVRNTSRMRVQVALALLVALCAGQVLFSVSSARASGSIYHVAPTGDDAADGLTSATSFRTINRCAAVAQPGDTCMVHEGNYRETVRPARSGTAEAPIRFEAAVGERVTVNGADRVKAWSTTPPSAIPADLASSAFADAVRAGSVQQATVDLDPALFANQLFVNGAMVNEARWPNTGPHPLTPTLAVADAGTTIEMIVDAEQDFPPGFWDDGIAQVTGGSMFWSHTGRVVKSMPGSFVFDSPYLIHGEDEGPLSPKFGTSLVNGCPFACARVGNTYYITGKLGGLDSAGEWFYDAPTSTLYFWPPEGVDPAHDVVEAKQRTYAFDLRGRSDVTVAGFSIFAATVLTDELSSANVLDGLSVHYVSHFVDRVKTNREVRNLSTAAYFRFDDANHFQENSGIILKGTGNVLRNSTITFSAGNGVSVQGDGQLVENNVITETVYSAAFNAPIFVGGKKFSRNHVIRRNTVMDAGGLAGILVMNTMDSYVPSFQNIQLSYNDVSNSGILTQDGGPLYICCTLDADLTVDHNWLRDHLSKTDRFDTQSFTGAGIYVDISSSNVRAHRNVITDNSGDALHLHGGGPKDSADRVLAYNNVFGPGHERSIGGGASQAQGTRIINNIHSSRSVVVGSGGVVQNNLPPTSDPAFVDPDNDDFSLQGGSPAIDFGQLIAGITDGFLGAAPDAGAYEHGSVNWARPGCDTTTCEIDRIDDTTGGAASAFSYTGPGWTPCAGCDPGSYPYNRTATTSSTVADTATLTFTGTAVQLHARIGPEQGIAGISIDGGPEVPIDTWAIAPGTGPDPRFLRGTGTGDQLVWRSPLLAPGEHTLKVRVTGDKRPEASGAAVTIDRADVFQTPTPVHWTLPEPADPPPPPPPPVAGEIPPTLRVAWASAFKAAGPESTPETTYRFILRPTATGSGLRVRLSNAFGTTPVTFAAGSVGERDPVAEGEAVVGSAIVAGTRRPLTFSGGNASVTVAPGQVAYSDVIDFDVVAQRDLAVSLYVPLASPTSTDSTGAVVRQYATAQGAGDRTADDSGAAFVSQGDLAPNVHWLDAVDVFTAAQGAVITVGDSITDGATSRANHWDPWPDVLSRRLAEVANERGRVPVANAAIGGNQTSHIKDRLERDVLSQTGVTHAVLLAGTNDLTGLSTGDDVIARLTELVTLMQDRGIKVVVGTLTPRQPLSTPLIDQHRHRINDWIRTTSLHDGFVDFDAAVRDPENPNQMRREYYQEAFGLHPNHAGYEVMAEAVDLALLTRLSTTSPMVSDPTLDPPAPVEGDAVVASAAFSDPGAGPFSCSVDYGSGGGAVAGVIANGRCTGPSHTYVDEGSFDVTVTVRNGEGGSDSATTSLAVANGAPAVQEPTFTADRSGRIVTASAAFVDPGVDDTFSCSVDYGDGTGHRAGTVSGRTCTGATHTYLRPDTYEVTIAVRDDDGGEGKSSATYDARLR